MLSGKQGSQMTKFVRFTETLMSQNGPPEQVVYINPEHVRFVRRDYGNGGSIIGLVGYDILVREDLDKVTGMLS
jgi:hypothetical protein